MAHSPLEISSKKASLLSVDCYLKLYWNKFGFNGQIDIVIADISLCLYLSQVDLNHVGIEFG